MTVDEHSRSDPKPGPGDAALALAPLIEHVRDGCFFVGNDLVIGFLNAAARRDMLARNVDPATIPGRNLWEVLGYAPDMPARIAVERALVERAPTYFTTRGKRAIVSIRWSVTVFG